MYYNMSFSYFIKLSQKLLKTIIESTRICPTCKISPRDLYELTLFPIVHSDDQTWHDNVQCPISGLVFFDKKKNLDASLLLKLIYIFCQVKRKKSSDFLTCYFSPFFAQWKKKNSRKGTKKSKIKSEGK